MDLYWRPLSPPIIPPEHPYYSREDVRNASRHPLHIVAAGSYCPRPPSPPPLCVDPRDVDPGYGFPKTEEERSCYPLTLDYLSDPEPAESESSSSRASSATPSCSDDESVSISPTRSATALPSPSSPKKERALPSPKKKWTTQSPKKKVTSHPYGEKNKITTDAWGRQLETCKLCGTRVQVRQMERHQKHKHPTPDQYVPAKERTCPSCKQVFSRVDAKLRHMRTCTAQRS